MPSTTLSFTCSAASASSSGRSHPYTTSPIRKHARTSSPRQNAGRPLLPRERSGRGGGIVKTLGESLTGSRAARLAKRRGVRIVTPLPSLQLSGPRHFESFPNYRDRERRDCIQL